MNTDQLKHKALELLEQTIEDSDVELSGAHSKSHLIITANLTQLIGKIYQYIDRELFLSYFAALFHDIVRSPAQDKDLNDEKLSAKIAINLLGQFHPTDEEKEAAAYAIENHGRNPSWMENPKSRENSPQSLKGKLHFALYVADKIEQNGVRVIARRCSFVAGERLHKENGDLQEFGFKPDKDEALVVAIESILRITFINPENIYPQKLRPIIAPLFKIHRLFTCAVLKSLHLNIKDIAGIILETKRADGKNLIEVRKIKGIKDSRDLTDMIAKMGQITDSEIQSVSDNLVKSSTEAIEYFGSHFEQDIDLLMLNWKPNNKTAQDWQRQMVEYLDGTWLNSINNLYV